LTPWIQREKSNLPSGISAEAIASKKQLPLWVAEILQQRMCHWTDSSWEAIDRFLSPSLRQLPDPFSLPDMDRGAERLAHALTEKQKVVIFADYDVDGTVGAAVMARFLRSFGLSPKIYQPDRQKEGYGINREALRSFVEEGFELLIAIDCGITSVEEVKEAEANGLNVIICDHHEPKEILPPAYAVLDQKRKDNEGPIRSLSGAGVAFYLAMATRALMRDAGLFEPESEMGWSEPDIKEYLDLVAVAAVADLVPLVEENRILVHFGLEKLRKRPNVGLAALFRVMGVKQEEASTFHLGFQIGPRINAAGRLGSANGALQLLLTDDEAEADRLASVLHETNAERIAVQGRVLEEAIKQASQILEEAADSEAALVVVGEDWHEGVIGIVASKLVDRFHRPALVITFATKNGRGKGSARAGSVLDLQPALAAANAHLVAWGGHRAAAGLSIEREELASFRRVFCEAVESQVKELTEGKLSVLPRITKVDAVLKDEQDLNESSVAWLERLAPFGMANPEPTILLKGWRLTGTKVLKERHLKVKLASTTVGGREWEGFWPMGVEKTSTDQGSVDVFCRPEFNFFKNRRSLEFKIKDIRESKESTAPHI
jgi:single-stranded-DNA-specific exonuclease